MLGLKDFRRRFPRGLGRPIRRTKEQSPNGFVWRHSGGPVDLDDQEETYIRILELLDIRDMEGASRIDMMMRQGNNVEGIIYKDDFTYRYYVWLTLAREIKTNCVRTGRQITVNRTAKVPFLIWFGSSQSFLSFALHSIKLTAGIISTLSLPLQCMQFAKHFFERDETDRSHLTAQVDGDDFTFISANRTTPFSHMNVLGRDFLDSRFRIIEADYNTLTVHCVRRKTLRDSRTNSLDWVRERDEELERYLQMDDENSEFEKDDDYCVELLEDGDSDGENLEEVAANGGDGNYAVATNHPSLAELTMNLEPDGPVDPQPRVAKRNRAEVNSDAAMADDGADSDRSRNLPRTGGMAPPEVSASGRVVGTGKETIRTRVGL
ncbi:hypothetical protein Dda_0289 [Drechslerella dactyloides]|uniref:Uncharacterized protein n=1 Tax=Drechslerella dactyloides TaxID=74499 RepID=A0AAD6J7P0_DREDA|nr:hypothetical protein Dda_0289 [Drechslerella dactyloides]